MTELVKKHRAMKYLLLALLLPASLLGQFCETMNEYLGIPEPVYTQADFLSPSELSALGACNCLRLGEAVFINQDLVDLLGTEGALAEVEYQFELGNPPYDSIGVDRYISDVIYVDVEGNTTQELWMNFTGYPNNPPEYVGDMGHLYTQLAAGGIAILDQLGQDWPFAVSSIRVNNPGWARKVLPHEAGHVVGSRHTHACAWGPNNNEAQDNCAGFTEGECDLPQSNTGGTMSYCHLGGNDVPWFGPEQAALIINKIATRLPCNCPEPPPAEDCQGDQVVLSILFDADPDEITWTFGPYTGGPYDEGTEFFTDTFCIEDTCWLFEITDSGGDGLFNCVEGFYQVGPYTGDDFSIATHEICNGSQPPVDNCGDFVLDERAVLVEASTHFINEERLIINGHGHAVIEGPFEITPSSILYLDYRNNIEPNYAGIGFGNNPTGPDGGHFIQFFGSDEYGYQWMNYYEDGYNWLYYNDPIGTYFEAVGLTGTYQYMYLVNSVTSFPYNAQSGFKDISICEATNPASEVLATESKATEVDQITHWPNPATDRLFFSSAVDYKLTDITGRVVVSGNGKVIDLSNHPFGVYVIDYEGQKHKLIIK